MSEHYLRVGDVLVVHGAEYAVDMVNDCRARCVRLRGSARINEDDARAPRTISVASIVEDSMVNRRTTLHEREAALSSQHQQGGETNTVKGKNRMSKEAVANQKEKPTQGRAAYIHNLKSKDVAKADALVKVQVKFNCPEGLFDKIWARGERGDAKPAAAKPSAKPAAKAAVKQTKAAPPAPPKKKAIAPPPPPADEEPAEEEALEEEAA